MGIFRKERRDADTQRAGPATNEAMIQRQIVERGITSPKVLAAFRQTDRREFVPESEIACAYEDHPIPLLPGSTVSQPFMVALMTDLLRVGPEHRVLEIGTGSGYQAAILSLLVKEVYGVELQAELVEFARVRLRRLGRNNVLVIHGNGWDGYAEAAPYDRIIVTAAPGTMPQALVDQLARGGRMVAPIGAGAVQDLQLIDKSASGEVSRMVHSAVQFVPLVDSREPMQENSPCLSDSDDGGAGD
jgi:protein-L-isoaspartate(D-aspartate) O-methyltransferase